MSGVGGIAQMSTDTLALMQNFGYTSLEASIPLARGRAVHIDHLPDDLLLEVFEHVRAIYLDDPSHRNTLTWANLRLVCTRWHRVTSSPGLWRIFTAGRSVGHLLFFLARSAGTLREIIFNSVEQLPWQLSSLQWQLMFPGQQPRSPSHHPSYRNSLRSLAFRLSAESNPQEWASSLVAFFAVDLPALTALEIALDHGHLDHFHALSLHPRRFPRLGQLRLRELAPPGDVANLRVLRFVGYGPRPNITPMRLLDTLRRSPDIEELVLAGTAVDVTASRSAPGRGPAPSPTLSRLRKLSIRDAAPDAIATLLAHIHAPFVAETTLAGVISKYGTHTIEKLLPPNASMVLPVFACPATVTLSTGHELDRTDSLEAQSGGRRFHLSIFAERSRGGDDPAEPPSATNLRAMLNILEAAGVRVTQLTVRGEQASPADSWRAVFASEALAELEELVVESAEIPRREEGVWEGLAAAGATCVPRLRCVRAGGTFAPEDAHGGNPTVATMMLVLQARAASGARLAELVFLDDYWDLDRAEEHGAQFVSELSSLVERPVFRRVFSLG